MAVAELIDNGLKLLTIDLRKLASSAIGFALKGSMSDVS
jgi:hypothetical protein